MDVAREVVRLLEEVENKNPLVHHITNFVTANDCANVVLALGGSPVMALDREEVEEMVSQASSLVINLGTLNPRTVQAIRLAGKKANERGIPVILDPVGVGATDFRAKTAQEIIRGLKLAVIRGNLSEIKVLAGLRARMRGVDAKEGRGGKVVAENLARTLGCVVVVTGVRDVISNGKLTIGVDNGHWMLARVTGTGCMLTSLIATFCGVTADYCLAAAAGTIAMGLAGERASQCLEGGGGPGTFRIKLLDHIYLLAKEKNVKGTCAYVI